MKKYLEIYVGSRGYLEGVEEKEFENIEDYLKRESDRNKEWIEEEEFENEEEKEEILGYWDWGIDMNGEYYLGLGDEEIKVYVELDSEKFSKWKKEKGIEGDIIDWDKIDSRSIKDLVD